MSHASMACPVETGPRNFSRRTSSNPRTRMLRLKCGSWPQKGLESLATFMTVADSDLNGNLPWATGDKLWFRVIRLFKPGSGFLTAAVSGSFGGSSRGIQHLLFPRAESSTTSAGVSFVCPNTLGLPAARKLSLGRAWMTDARCSACSPLMSP